MQTFSGPDRPSVEHDLYPVVVYLSEEEILEVVRLLEADGQHNKRAELIAMLQLAYAMTTGVQPSLEVSRCN